MKKGFSKTLKVIIICLASCAFFLLFAAATAYLALNIKSWVIADSFLFALSFILLYLAEDRASEYLKVKKKISFTLIFVVPTLIWGLACALLIILNNTGHVMILNVIVNYFLCLFALCGSAGLLLFRIIFAAVDYFLKKLKNKATYQDD